jgi:glycosyltransferase involved in cell wall biosynthesis
VRILQAISDTDRRGAQMFAVYLGDALAERGHVVSTVALAPGTMPATLDLPVLASNAIDRRALRALRREMTESDVTIAHGSSTLPACSIAGLGPGRPFVYRQISDPEVWSATPLRRLRSRLALSRGSHVVALSDHNRAQLKRHLRVELSRCTVIPNAVPTTVFAPAGAGGREQARQALGLADVPTVLFVGTLSWEKAPAVAVEAMGLLADAHLVVAGDGPERTDLEALARRVASGRVSFVGTVPDMTRLYASADLLLLTSRTEATPGVLIEAGMAGLPVVAARVGAVPEIVEHEVTGLLVESDRPADFAAAVERLLSGADLAGRLGTAARQRCEAQFEIHAVAAAWEEVLDKVRRGARSAPPGSRPPAA